MKKLVSLLLALTMVLSMAVIANAEDEPITLKVLWWGSQTRHDTTTALCKLYEETHPNVKVEIDYAAWSDYWTKLATQVSGETLPDVIQMDYGYLTQYAENGILANLDEYIAAGKMDVSNAAESIIASGKWNGSVYAIPTGTNALVLMYNPEMLEGYEVPAYMTYEEYIDLCKHLYADKGLTENYLSGADMNRLRFYVRNYGYELYSEDQTALGFTDAQLIADQFEYIATSIKEGWGLNPAKAVAADSFSSITAGDTWAVLHWTNELNATETGNGVSLQMVALPAADGAVRPATFFKPSMFWSVSEKSQVKDAAVDFINFYINDLRTYEICGTDRGFPISSVVLEALTPSFSEQNKKIAAILNDMAASGNTSPIMPSDPTANAEVSDLYGDYVEKIQYGQITDYKAAAEEFMEKANELLSAGK